MPSLEDYVYKRMYERLSTQAVILSAHPPSGKAYDTDLIRIPAKQRHAGRYHLDFIFLIGTLLFLCELKGKSSESLDDVTKLRNLCADYALGDLIRFISKRVDRQDVDWNCIEAMVPMIGVSQMDLGVPSDIVTVIATEDPCVFEIVVGDAIPQKDRVQHALATVF